MRRFLINTVFAGTTLVAGLAASPARAQTAARPDRPADSRALRRTPVVGVFQRNKDAVVYLTGPIVQAEKSTTEEFFALPGEQEEKISVGSGFLIHPTGYVVANAHAAEQVISHEVTLADGKKVPAELIALVRQQDLALLKIDAGRRLPAVRMAKADDLMIGETVVVIANPHGLLHTCTKGIVSAVGRSTNPSGLRGVTLHGLIQTDAAINLGSSGGPWFNVAGEMIGMTTTKKEGSENIGFAVPVAALRKVLPEMLDVRRRYGLLIGFAVAKEGPARIATVEPDTPAAKAGLKVGDVISKAGGQSIDDRADLELALVGRKPGETLDLELIRDGDPLAATLIPAERPKADCAALLKQKLSLAAVPLDAQKAKAMRLRVARGVVLTEVDAKRYEGAGDPPRPGDVLARINKIRPRDLEHLCLLLDRIEPGRTVTMVLLRKQGDVITRIDLITPAR